MGTKYSMDVYRLSLSDGIENDILHLSAVEGQFFEDRFDDLPEPQRRCLVLKRSDSLIFLIAGRIL
jgi:hypothetical protein